MASALPLLLIGAALLLMGKKKGGGSAGNGLPSGAGATGDGNGNGNGTGAGDGTGDGAGDGAGDGTGDGAGDGAGNGIPSDGIPAQSMEPEEGPDSPDPPKPQYHFLVLPFAMAPPPGPGDPPPDPDAPEPDPDAPEPEPEPEEPPPPPPPAPGSDVPEGAYCSDVANWDAAWVAKELEMLAAVNAVRAQGFSCPGVQQSPVAPLVMNPSLRCAARKHSKDMAENGFFAHTNPQGEESWDRMMAAGYNGTGFSENIAAGSPQIQHTMDQWLTSTAGHCEALFDPAMTEIGIGYYPTGAGYQFYWTQNFGKY